MLDVWHYLSQTNKPIVLYGMGNGADKILSVFSKYNIKISGIFASDGFSRKNIYAGYPVETYSEIKEKFGEMIVILSFATSRPEVLQNIQRIANEQELIIPDVAVVGDNVFDNDFYNSNKDLIVKARNLLVDDRSKEVFDLICEARMTGSFELLKKSSDDDSAIDKEMLSYETYNSYVDAGAYTGDTVLDVMSKCPNMKKIWAIEPERHSINKMQQRLLEYRDKCKIIQAACWNCKTTMYFSKDKGRGSKIIDSGNIEVSADTVDNIVNGEKVDYIKYDVEGAEWEAILGSDKTIIQYHPDMQIALYHHPQDLFDLILKVNAKYPEYQLNIRRKMSVPAWDIDLFATVRK